MRLWREDRPVTDETPSAYVGAQSLRKLAAASAKQAVAATAASTRGQAAERGAAARQWGGSKPEKKTAKATRRKAA